MAESHDEVLRKHREKFEQHRQWMSQKQAELQGLEVGSTPRDSLSQQHQHEGSQGMSQQQHRAPSSARGTSWGGPSKHSDAGGAHSGYPAAPAAANQGHYGPGGLSARGSSYGGSGPAPVGSPLSVHSRSTQWNKRRNQRLEEMRRQRKDETNDECTFTPMVSQPRKVSMERERSVSVQGGEADPIYVKGYDEFLSRQEASRKLQEEKKKRLKSDGSGWRNEVTVTDAFQLGNRRPESLSALQRPIRAPLRHGVNDNHELVSNEASPLPTQGEVNPFEQAGMPPKGTFSERSSAAIIDIAAVKPQSRREY